MGFIHNSLLQTFKPGNGGYIEHISWSGNEEVIIKGWSLCLAEDPLTPPQNVIFVARRSIVGQTSNFVVRADVCEHYSIHSDTPSGFSNILKLNDKWGGDVDAYAISGRGFIYKLDKLDPLCPGKYIDEEYSSVNFFDSFSSDFRNIIDWHEMLDIIKDNVKTILEIGPFDSPEFVNCCQYKVEYADILSTELLKKRAAIIENRNPSSVPDINYVVSDGYNIIKNKFDLIYSSQCIEHQPDLLGHLLHVKNLLKKNGLFIFTVADKSTFFDRYIPESVITEIIAAYLEKRTNPGLRSIIEHVAYTTPDTAKSASPYKEHTLERRKLIDGAFIQYIGNEYVDVHCWQFTPTSLHEIMLALRDLGYLPESMRVKTFLSCKGITCIIKF
ncbi:MAG: class I SAM-dependent methyltransferase [Desulfarculales bacterium]|jgi:SAM-dependent methyltransferase|nr:class I SAM-dependent methyltransferase [Desulfarculales bacterium]